MISERYVEPERVETYEKEADQLESRMNRINLKCMDKSQRYILSVPLILEGELNTKTNLFLFESIGIVD